MLTGAMTAMVTPFRNGKVDESRLREQVEYQIAQGIDGLVPVGTTGESPTLDFAEHERVISLTVEYARKRVPVIGGAGGKAASGGGEMQRPAEAGGGGGGFLVERELKKQHDEGGLWQF